MTDRLAEYELGGADAGPERRVDKTSLCRYVVAILEASEYSTDRATVVADSLVDAEARGIASHGVTRVRIYSKRARAGLVDPRADPVLNGGHKAGRLVDANNSPGQIAAVKAVDEAVAGARELGVCVVGVINSNHCGTLAYYLRRIASHGLIGFGATNGPPVMTFHGGRTRAVGTNPLGYAFPRPGAEPIVLDMATSSAARGKIIHAARTGSQQIPDGWAVDVDGRPTTDAAKALAGAVVPFAGAKGSGLAMGVELLCGVLLSGVTGAGVGDMYENWDRTQRVGHIFGALDPTCWGTREAYEQRVQTFLDEVADLPPAEGHERVLFPGEIEERLNTEAADHGVLLPGAVIEDLQSLADDLEVSEVLEIVESEGRNEIREST